MNSECHPDSPVTARGMCQLCYNRWYTKTGKYLIREAGKVKRMFPLSDAPVCPICNNRPCSKQYRFNPKTGRSCVKDGYFTRSCRPCKGTRPKDVNARLKERYGITADDKTLMLKSQDGKCWICRTSLPDLGGCVDHCHLTGKVRGVLCGFCNKMLGLARDSIETLENAIRYLKEKAGK